MKIGVYGGTFDPIHRGHMAAAEAAASVLGLNLLLLIPAGIPPHKQLADSTAPAADRLAMTRIAADRLRVDCKVKVLDTELERSGKSYTSDTLRDLRKKYPEDELWLLMGTDMFLTLQAWHEPEEICRLAGICAFGRTEQDGEELFAPQREFLKMKYDANIVTVTVPGLVDVSSTQLRARLERGEMPEELDESVFGYILLNRLYRTHADLTGLDYPRLRACSYSMIKSKRIPHVRGTEEEAVRLARRWGVDEDMARTAAILHDCTKYFDLEKQLKLCGEYGILLDNVERQAVNLLHGKTGAGIAKNVFGAPQEVCDAISFHTTGKGDMTRLEKILYIADYMEPTRDFDGVERLRALVYEDLDRAVLLGLRMGIEEMEEKGWVIHWRSMEAEHWLSERLK